MTINMHACFMVCLAWQCWVLYHTHMTMTLSTITSIHVHAQNNYQLYKGEKHINLSVMTVLNLTEHNTTSCFPINSFAFLLTWKGLLSPGSAKGLSSKSAILMLISATNRRQILRIMWGLRTSKRQDLGPVFSPVNNKFSELLSGSFVSSGSCHGKMAVCLSMRSSI